MQDQQGQTPPENSRNEHPETSLVRSKSEATGSDQKDHSEARALEAKVAQLPVWVDVQIPIPGFRVADLLALEPGKVLASEWPSTEDMPLSCGDVQLVWSEFEVVDQRLAVRVTRLV